MKLEDLKDKLIKCNPNDVIKEDMDGFSPYIYFELPEEIAAGFRQLNIHDAVKWDEWLNELLYNARVGNPWKK